MPATDEQQRLAEQHLGLVRAQAAAIKKGLPETIEFDDLVAYGTKGLMEAAARYQPNRGFAFSTFAYYRIRGAIYDGLRSMGWVGRREFARVRQRARVDAYLQSQAERQPSDAPRPLEDDVAALADRLAGVATIFVTSLEAEERYEPVAEEPRPDEMAEQKELRSTLRDAIDALPEQERHLVEAFYFRDTSLLAAGKELGISKSWASRLHASAVDRLRRILGDQEPVPGEERPPPGEPAGRRGTPLRP